MDEELLESIQGRTLTSDASQRAMLGALATVDREGVEGDVVECGVWRGGNLILARKASPGRVCWAFDTFQGMTLPGPEDVSRGGKIALDGYWSRREKGVGWCVASLEEVKVNLSEAGAYDETRLRFVMGDVCETLLDPANLPEKISLCHLDTDWYRSTKVELEVLYPRLSPGGICIIDDWGHWKGARKACDEYFGADFEFTAIDYTAILVRKPC